MRTRPLNIAMIGRAAGFVLVAAAIVATAISFHRDDARRNAPVSSPAIQSDPLARELARCQAIGMAAEDDAACKAAWTENRRRFFASPPTEPASSKPTGEQKPADNPEDR